MATALVEPDREFEELYRRYAAEVQRYALAVSQNEVDAEDVTQQTFMNAYRALVRGEQPRAPRHWLIAIAHNVYRERLRRSSRRPTEVALDDNLRAVASDESRWSAEEIRHALSHLCRKQRAVIVLRELEGRPYAEIAEMLGLSQSATEALAFRARRALREQLESEVTCDQALAAVGRGLDGALSAPEHRALRAHLRACEPCAGLARRSRGRRRRIGGLALLPFPLPLKSLFGGGSLSAGAASAGGGVAVKAAAVAAAGAVATGVGYETARHVAVHPSRSTPHATVANRSSSPSVLPKTPSSRQHPAVRHEAPVAAPRPAKVKAQRHHRAPASSRPVKHRKPTSTQPTQGLAHDQTTKAVPDDTLRAPAQKPASKSHGPSRPAAAVRVARPHEKPAKHEHVQKAQHRRPADPPGQARKTDGKPAGNDSGTHGKGDSGESKPAAVSLTKTGPPAPPPPHQAGRGPRGPVASGAAAR